MYKQVHGADFPCKTEQIHWVATSGKRYECLECPNCTTGSQPSVPCGSSVAYGTPVHCISCQLGKTYSNKYGKEPCKACTVCSQGKAIKKNCTLFSNSECDDKCAHGFYSEPFTFSCFPCTQCCNDSKDEMVEECANYGKKCKVRLASCSNVPTTASQSEKTFIKTTQPGRMQIDMRILVTTGAVIAILATLGLLAYVMCGRQTNRDINNVDGKSFLSMIVECFPYYEEL